MLTSRADGASRLDRLAARPPTPPKDSSKTTTTPFSPDTNKTVDDALRFLDEGHHDIPVAHSSPRINSSTDTPPSKAPASSARGSTASKKVGFLLEPTHQVPAPSCSPQISHDSPALRTSGPLKSILKRSIEQLPPTPDDVENRLSFFSPQEPGSFRRMLQSVLKQLGGTSRDGRRDAYLCLNGALKHHSDLPDRDALVDRIDLLQQFLARDMAWRDSKGALDLQIVTQALNLTSALLWDPVTAQALDDDLRTFLVDRSMVMLEQPDSPKPVIKAHLHILMVQQFPSSIMTQNKTERIVTALQNIEERCSGNSVISARLTVYQRLASQQPPVMISRMHDWMEHLLAGMLSSINDTRLRAIDVCNHIALHLGSYPSASRALFDIFDTETDEGITYGKHFNAKLMEMVSDKELAHFVPQIWASIILFCRTKRKPIDRWPMLKTFLATMQRCLNSGDMGVKQWAHTAWSKLIFAVSPDSATTPSMRSMLRLPIVGLLERRGNDRFSLQAKELGLISYNYLLHYGLRPSLSHEELDGAWKLYVEEVLPKLAQSSRRGQTHACRVLQGLLQRKKNLWNENAAVETATQMKPQDLPQLDAKWVRSRLGRIIAVLEPIITAGMCSPPESNQAANTCWRLLFQAVADAGSQEVKASNELKVALAEVINFLRRLWHAPASSRTEVEASLWLDRYQLLLEICVETLGPGHFVEDFLAKTNADEVEATPTPSNRTSKHQKTAYSPFVFLFALYYQPPKDDHSNEAYIQSAAWYLNMLAGARGSASGTIGLLHRSLQFCSDQNPPRNLGEQLWGVAVENAAGPLSKQTSDLPQHNAQTVGVALRSALNIITFGLRKYPSSSTCSQKATELYDATCIFAKRYGNDGGVALGVMEPLAKTLLDMRDDLSVASALQICSAILDHGVWPKSRQDLEQSRKALWSVSLDPPSKASSSIFDPFDHIYSFINAISPDAYNQLSRAQGAVPSELLSGYLTVMMRFLQRCPDKILPSSLRRVQSAVAVFAEDRHRTLFPLSAHKKDEPFGKVANALPSLWADLLGLVQDVTTRYDSTSLETLEPLLVAGLSSPSKEIVSKTITFWNESFGAQDFLEYPPKLLTVVRARRVEAEIRLPGLSDDESDVELAELPAFAESQMWLDPEYSSNLAVGRSPKPLSKLSRSLLGSPNVTPGSFAAKRAKSSKSTPKARLRHDNSQLEFAAIESSSAMRSSNEESQLLTEHQKEVKARQYGDAQMFPELSSSPGQTGQNRKAIAKKLDFSSDANRGKGDDEELATPVGLADGNPMSDDLPSSPTPRASAAAQEVEQYSDDDATEIMDPPSSPPRHPEDADDGTAERIDETTLVIDDGSAEHEASLDQPASPVVEEASKVAASDLVSDSLLPTAQLEREAAAAAAAEAQKTDHAVHEDDSANDKSISRTPSRIEESFIEQIDEVASPGDVSSNAATPQGSQSKRKKRQRLQSEDNTPRKRAKNASPSPIKDLWKRWTSKRPAQDAEEDEDDDADVQEIAEEIVVATRRRTDDRSNQSMHEPEPEPSMESQEEKHIKRRRGRPKKSYSPPKEPEPVVESQEQSQQPVKRGRGRPRRNPLADSSQMSTSAGQKRRASVASNATTEEATSFVAGTPAVATTRKAARLSQGVSDAGSSHRQAVAQEEAEAGEPQEGSNLSAKAMLSKLYGMLADIPKMVFGSQDERAFDDVLFEFRREVHEAGRRGREQLEE